MLGSRPGRTCRDCDRNVSCAGFKLTLKPSAAGVLYNLCRLLYNFFLTKTQQNNIEAETKTTYLDHGIGRFDEHNVMVPCSSLNLLTLSITDTLQQLESAPATRSNPRIHVSHFRISTLPGKPSHEIEHPHHTVPRPYQRSACSRTIPALRPDGAGRFGQNQ